MDDTKQIRAKLLADFIARHARATQADERRFAHPVAKTPTPQQPA